VQVPDVDVVAARRCRLASHSARHPTHANSRSSFGGNPLGHVGCRSLVRRSSRRECPFRTSPTMASDAGSVEYTSAVGDES
jgi:hypothetical protein